MKVLIIEDETVAARRLQKLISEIVPDVNIEAQLESIESTLLWFDKNTSPDLLFLDINLVDGSSFEIFNHLNIECPIIFTTAYDEFALKAFKVNAIDYLLKPIKRTDLEKAIEKYKRLQKKKQFDYSKLTSLLETQNASKRFLIRMGQNIRLVDIKDVAYFYTENKITFLVGHSGKRYPLDYSLEKLDEMLDKKSFFRINRQFIINIEAIKEMYAYSKARVKIDLNPPCRLDTIVSTERSPYFKKWLVGE